MPVQFSKTHKDYNKHIVDTSSHMRMKVSRLCFNDFNQLKTAYLTVCVHKKQNKLNNKMKSTNLKIVDSIDNSHS